MLTFPRLVRIFVFASLTLAMTAPMMAETTQCTAITSVPYSIDAPGAYCLTGDLGTAMTSGTAISINANSVTLDLNGFKLAGNAGAGTSAFGIRGSNRKHVVIKNGIVRGFLQGVTLDGSGVANIIEGLTLEKNWNVAIVISGTGSVVRRNLIVNTGGTSFYGSNTNGLGIVAVGTGNVIRDNDISNVAGSGTGSGYGIGIASQNTLVESNRVANSTVGVNAPGGYTNILVSDNRFMNMTLAMSLNEPSHKYRNNFTTGVTTLASGGTDAGGNN